MNTTGVPCLSGPNQRWSQRTGPSRPRHVLQGTWFEQAQDRQIKCELCPLVPYHTAYKPKNYYHSHMFYELCTTVWVIAVRKAQASSRGCVLGSFASRSATKSNAQHLALRLFVFPSLFSNLLTHSWFSICFKNILYLFFRYHLSLLCDTDWIRVFKL